MRIIHRCSCSADILRLSRGVAISAQSTGNRNHACLCVYRGAQVWSRLGLLRRSLPVSYFHLITDDGD